ncbi:MAG: hypothetical protein RBU37_13870 [Myxococcota bacterium]|jgi:hypothetical protein|nr:hypothetical protein [Myxococcota bacterium]
MSLEAVPRNHVEREQLVRALEAWIASQPPELALQINESVFAAAKNAYLDLSGQYQAAKGAERAASDAADAADRRFDPAFRNWSNSVRDERGVARSSELSAILGMSPGELVQRTYAVEVLHTQKLLTQLESRADLRGDPSALAELTAATAALAISVADDEKATLARLAIGREYSIATKDFDRSYRKLRRALSPILGKDALDAAFPLFVRAERKIENE